jgi:predicted MFS family arabinose efflux permease
MDTMAQSGFKTFIAFLMIERGIPVSLAALALVLTLAGGVVGKFCCGFLAARMGIIRSLVLVEVLTAVGILGVVFAPAMVAFALLPVLGAFLQGSTSITYGTIGDLVDRDRQARGFSLIYTTSTAASVLASVALGVLGDIVGIGPMMLTIAVITLLPLALCGLLSASLDKGAG